METEGHWVMVALGMAPPYICPSWSVTVPLTAPVLCSVLAPVLLLLPTDQFLQYSPAQTLKRTGVITYIVKADQRLVHSSSGSWIGTSADHSLVSCPVLPQ